MASLTWSLTFVHPPSSIATLSSGEFVGMVADAHDCRIDLKSFHCEILNDHQSLKKERKNYNPIPVIRKVENKVFYRYKILDHYMVAVDATGVISSDEDRFGCGLKKDSKNGKITYLYRCWKQSSRVNNYTIILSFLLTIS